MAEYGRHGQASILLTQGTKTSHLPVWSEADQRIIDMGVGPVAILLYFQLASTGLLKRGLSICEIGSQDVSAGGFEGLVERVFKAMGSSVPSAEMISRVVLGGPSRELMQSLGMKYACIDTDGRHGAIVLDLNFDNAPADQRGRFDVVANHGTTEHVFNQANAFRVIHDLTKVGGLMIHCLPFRGYAGHCFFGYHPDLFEALARANGYALFGMWLTFGDAQSHLIPWNDRLLDDLKIGEKTNVLLTVVFERRFAQEFQFPFQIGYEATNVDENAARYQYVLDGELLDGRTIKKFAIAEKRVDDSQKDPQSLLVDRVQQIPFRVLFATTCSEFIRRAIKKVTNVTRT